MTQVTLEKNIPTSIHDVAKHNKYKWSCQTTNILDDQNLSWSLFRDEKHQWCIKAFNRGNGINILNLETNSFDGYVFIDKLVGEDIYTDVALHKGSIKHMSHRINNEVLDDTMGDLYLKISAFINMHFNKYSGYICFHSKGRNIISISLHLDKKILDLYSNSWVSNLNNIYNGRGWK